jgi:SNF2 family DNA or RNA helicase
MDGLKNFEPAFIDGGVGPRARAVEIERFQNDSRCRVFIGQTIACHTGITLTAAHRVVLVEPDWTGNINLQAAHRVARIGQQKSTCIAQYITLAGTLDEAIIRNIDRERARGDTLYTKEAAT